MKNKTTEEIITPRNYRKFKPSEFIRSFVSDLEVGISKSKQTGKHIDMWSYKPSSNCLPCLGGLACMNFGSRTGYSFETTDPVLINTAHIGNSLRVGDDRWINAYIRNLYPDYKSVGFKALQRFNGYYAYYELQPLIDQIHYVADAIERSGQ